MRWEFHGMGWVKLKGENVGLVPGLMMQYQGGAMEWVMSALVGYELKEESRLANISHVTAFKLGVGFRSKESVIPILELEIFSFKLGISYDIVFSDLRRSASSPGSLELTLRYIYTKKNKEQASVQK